MTDVRTWCLVSISLLTMSQAGCGSSSKKGGTPCPSKTAVGAVLICTCGAAKGTQTCQVDMTVTECSCGASDGGTAGTGGNSSNSSQSGSGSAGASGSGGKSGAGGSGGSGTATDAGASGSGGGAALPMNGNQLAVCTHVQGDCNKGFGCVSPNPPGQGYCSKTCMMAADCAGLAPSGSMYTCTAGGLCQLGCMNAMDTTTCAAGMTCQAAGGGGGMMSYRCKYPAPASDAGTMMAGTTVEWGKCMRTTDCAMGLTCVGAALSMSRTGFCSKTCMMNTDCSTKPGTGTIAPTCVAAGGRAARSCALACGMGGSTCPDGMTCGMAGGMMGGMAGASYCEFM
jgi:hypothetical protein